MKLQQRTSIVCDDVACRRTFVLALFVASLGGCGKQPALSPVIGTVTVNGEPGARLLILFYRVNDPAPYPSPASALTDEQGHFALTTAKEADGALAGEYAVVCHWQDVRFSAEGEPVYSGLDRLGSRYADRTKT